MDFLGKMKDILTGKKAFDREESLREKRYSPRIRCEVQGICTCKGNIETPVFVTEIGLYGLRIHIVRMLKPGDDVLINAIKGIGILAGARYSVNDIKMTVQWCKKRKKSRDHMVGLRYNDTKKNLRDSWVALLLKKFGVAVGVSTQKRKRVRIPSNLPLTFSSLRGEDNNPGIVKDLGLGGMLVAAESGLVRNESFRFRIGPYKALAPLSCTGKVLHVRFLPSAGKWVAGVIFNRLNDGEEKVLNTYIETLFFEKSD